MTVNSKKARRWRVHNDDNHALDCTVSDRIAICDTRYRRIDGGYIWGVYGSPAENGYPLASGANEDALKAKKDARAALDRIASEISDGTFKMPEPKA